MTPTRRLGLATLALVLTQALPALAQDYPNKPIKIIAPFAAGTGPVLDDHRLAKRIRERRGHDAADGVHRTAGCDRHNQFHRLVRIGLREGG